MKIQDIIRIAITNRYQLDIFYDDKTKKTNRTFEPMYFFTWDTHYYLVGYCCLRDSKRTLKLSRILECRILRKKTEHPIIDPIDALTSDYFLPDDVIIDIYPIETRERLKNNNIRLKEEMVKEFPKTIRLSKMTREGIIRSPLEEKVISKLQDDPSVELLTVEPIKIEYFFDGEHRIYIPDLMVRYVDGHIDLVEVKVSGDISEPKNQAKFLAAESFCKEKGYDFIVLGVSGKNNRRHHRSDWQDEFFSEIEQLPTTPMSLPQSKPSKRKSELWEEWLAKYLPLTITPSENNFYSKELTESLVEAASKRLAPNGKYFKHKLLACEAWEMDTNLIQISQGLKEAYLVISDEDELTRKFNIPDIEVVEVLPRFGLNSDYYFYPHADQTVQEDVWLDVFAETTFNAEMEIIKEMIEDNFVFVKHLEGHGRGYDDNEIWVGLFTNGSHYGVYWGRPEDEDKAGFPLINKYEKFDTVLWFNHLEHAQKAYEEISDAALYANDDALMTR
ncbi:TnsA endonuclease N-terminal domain-containing protein [Paenibacillus sp. FSL K6-2862]|uniref:TnsA endonuclease N-terminal domain-containing protein n=1 Tax=Paenibacillus sp. FSL K6-2862 TaxID=2921484 RepID=UPI0030F8FC2A